MILAIDIGNNHIVIGGIDNSTTYFVERVATDHTKTEFEYAVNIQNVMELHQLPIPLIEGAIVSSVVPPLTNVLISAVKKSTKITPFLVGSGMKTGLNIKMDNPKSVGSDLIVNAVAAINEYPSPIIIIYMGTATTISAIDQKGDYIGGIIFPGLRVSLDSLSSQAAQLPFIGLDKPEQIIGKNTNDCMKNGILYGNAAMIDGIINQMENELNTKACLIATGELITSVLPLCTHKIHYDDALLLKGLLILYEKNRKI